VIDLLEQAFVDRLKLKLPAFKVEPFPDAPEAYPFTKATSTLLVNYGGSTYGADKSAAPLHTERQARVVVTILTRKLRGTTGVVTTVHEVMKSLYGWRPERRVETPVEGGDPIVTWVPLGFNAVGLVDDKHVGHESGVWRWDVTFRVGGVVVQDLADLTGPQFKKASALRGEGGCS